MQKDAYVPRLFVYLLTIIYIVILLYCTLTNEQKDFMNKSFKLVIDEKAWRQLLLLQEKTEAKDLVEIFRKSLAVYDVLTDVAVDGGEIFIRWPDKREQELRL